MDWTKAGHVCGPGCEIGKLKPLATHEMISVPTDPIDVAPDASVIEWLPLVVTMRRQGS